MKKFAILLALLMVQVQLCACAATTTNTKKPATQQNVQTKTVDGYKQDGSDFLLKYNIKDLEAAPWLNNGTRKPEGK